MNNRLTGVLALAVLLIMGMIVPAGAETEHCPGANAGAPILPDGYSVLLDNDTTEVYPQADRNDTVLPAGTQVCVKGGTVGASGIVTAAGDENLRSILGSGQDVSYYMTYARAQDEPEPLKPILECVSEDTAYFGYLNENDVPVHVSIGDGNKVTGIGDIDQGQPTEFLVGRTDYVDMAGTLVPGNAAFSTPYSGSDIVWTLTGPDGTTRTATAGANSPVCPEPPVDYCDPTQRPAGMSIADWLPDDFDTQTCFEIVPDLACGFFDATVTGPLPGYELVFLRGAGETTSLDWETLPATPEEDAGDGSVAITVYLVGPESDYLVGSGLPNYWDDNGRTVTIDTDCEQPVEPLTGVRGTFMCKAPSDGSFELYVGGETGFVSRVLDEGDYVFRYTNPNDEDVRFSAGTPAGNDDVVPEWMTLGADQTVFESFGSAIAGVSTNTVPLDDTADPVNRGTFSTNETQVCEATPVDDTPPQIVVPTTTELPIIATKIWTGDVESDAFDVSALDITFTIDGAVYEPGDTLDAVVSITGGVVTEPTIDFEGEVVTGLDEDLCSYEFVSASLEEVDGAGPWVLEVTNVVACGQDTETEVLPEVVEAEPEPEVVEEDVDESVVEEEAEVLGVTETRAVPTGIDSGSGGYLPNSTPTAALLLMLFGGLALVSGATASLVRRDR